MRSLARHLPGLLAALLPCATPASEVDAPRLAVQEIELIDEAASREHRFRVAIPQRGGPYPLVVFSHGAFCGPDRYARVIDHWAVAGYAVVAPRHIDAMAPREDVTRMDPAVLLDARLADVQFAISRAGAIAAVAGLPEDRIDTERAAIAGHSFGGMVAQIIAGMRTAAPEGGAAVDRSDSRFAAAVVMSGVGPMASISADGFAFLSLPLIATGGTLDLGDVGSGAVYPWEWRMSPYALAPPGDKYALVIDQADHYLGGLICRSDVAGPPDHYALGQLRAATTLFLDAYLKRRNAPAQALRQLVGEAGRREFALK